MSKPAMLSDEAYEALMAQKKGKKDSLSAVIMRFVPRPINTFGDLERHLNDLDAPLADVDLAALERVKRRKRKLNHAH